jgi:hypothetical protein
MKRLFKVHGNPYSLITLSSSLCIAYWTSCKFHWTLCICYTKQLFSCTRATSNLLIIPPLHNHSISQYANVHFSMVLMLRTYFKSWKPPRFDLFYHQAMHLFQLFGQQPFGTICDNASAQCKWDKLIIVLKQCPPLPKPTLVKLTLQQLLQVLGLNV